MIKFENEGFQWGGTKSETPSGAICVSTPGGFRYPLVFHTFSKATVEARFIDFKKEPYVDELLNIFEEIDGIKTDVIRANGYRAKPKIEVSRFDHSQVSNALLELCRRVAKG